MTSATTRRLVDEDRTAADAFDAGSGRIQLKGALDPGLTFDVPAQDWIDHEGDLWTVNSTTASRSTTSSSRTATSPPGSPAAAR